MEKKIVIYDTKFSDEQNAAIKKAAGNAEFISVGELTPEKLRDFSAAVGNIPAKILSGQDQLEWVQLFNDGADRYLAPGIMPEGTVLTCGTGAYGTAISEYMIACLLMLMKNLPTYLDRQRAGIWKRGGSVESPVGKRVLIVGTGNIGLSFAKRIRALGAGPIVGIRRRAEICPEGIDEIHGMDGLAEEIPKADIIALCLPKTAATAHVLDREMLSMCRKGAYLINVGRGNAIETKVLLDPEISGRFAGIWLDVFEEEPLPEGSPFFSIPNLIVTPHISGGFFLKQTIDNVFEICMKNIAAWKEGGKFINVVDRKQGYAN